MSEPGVCFACGADYGLVEALGEALYLLDDVSGLEDHPTLAKAREALRSVGREVVR